jgi:uncharacterized protein YdaU (DUF1376 family)
MHYYQFHIADFALHTTHLTLEEEAVYRRLLDFYYDTEKPIPKETSRVIRRLRLIDYSNIVESVLVEFFILQDDGWHNLRADEEIKSYQSKADIARENGKKGGRPKKNNQQKTQPVILANQEETGSKANHKPITRTNNQEPKKHIRAAALDYSVWPESPSEQVLSDWLAMRKRLKADVSQTVINNFAKELSLARSHGFSVDYCLSECVARNWRGFKYQWISEANNATRIGNVRPSREERQRKAMEEAFSELYGDPRAIDADFECIDDDGTVEQGGQGHVQSLGKSS